jgi:hypothetical protein
MATSTADPRSRTITLSGAPIHLDPAMADGFDQAFAEGGHVFNAGEAIGTLSFSVKGQ